MGSQPRRRGSRHRRAVLVAAWLAGCSSGSSDEPRGVDRSPDTGSSGFCRATTCAPDPSEYPTSDGQCEPPDWADSPACRNAPEHPSNAPLWWRTACVGYDLNQSASRAVDYDAFAAAAAAAFTTWTSSICASATGPSAPLSIDVRDLGPVSCATAGYDKGGRNQNVIVFHDDAWPYEQQDQARQHSPKSLTVALTWTTYDAQTGELFDADIELNSADYDIVPLADDAGAGAGPSAPGDAGRGPFDLQTILTHEAGHFLGLAHSPLPTAVMYKYGDTSSATRKRSLAHEDVAGICSIYLPDGARSVSTLVDGSGRMPEGTCDPTPRGGFTASCD